jgi:hypothetical protein
MAAKIFTRAYAASMSSIDALEKRCEGDEAGFMGKLISLQLGTDTTEAGTVDVTAAKYERVLGVTLGHLIVEEFKDENDAISRIAIHETRKEPLVCKGKAYIVAKPKNVIVFREKTG